MTECSSDLEARSLATKVNTSKSYDEIVRLEALGGKEKGGTKALNMQEDMKEDVIFCFNNPLSIP